MLTLHCGAKDEIAYKQIKNDTDATKLLSRFQIWTIFSATVQLQSLNSVSQIFHIRFLPIDMKLKRAIES